MEEVLKLFNSMKDDNEQMLAKMDANHEKRMTMIRAWRQTDNEEEAMASEEKDGGTS
jgi:hypothetical protein